MPESDYPIFPAEINKVKKRFYDPLLTSNLAVLTQSSQTTIPLNQTLVQRD